MTCPGPTTKDTPSQCTRTATRGHAPCSCAACREPSPRPEAAPPPRMVLEHACTIQLSENGLSGDQLWHKINFCLQTEDPPNKVVCELGLPCCRGPFQPPAGVALAPRGLHPGYLWLSGWVFLPLSLSLSDDDIVFEDFARQRLKGMKDEKEEDEDGTNSPQLNDR